MCEALGPGMASQWCRVNAIASRRAFLCARARNPRNSTESARARVTGASDFSGVALDVGQVTGA